MEDYKWGNVDTWNPPEDLMTGKYEVQTRVKDSFLNRDHSWSTVAFDTLRARIATLSDMRVYTNQEYRIRKLGEDKHLNMGKLDRVEVKENGDFELFFKANKGS